MHFTASRARTIPRALGFLALGAVTLGAAAAPRRAAPVGVSREALATAAATVAAMAPSTDRSVLIGDSLYGRSGKLRARLVSTRRVLQLPILTQLFGDSAALRPGIYPMPDSTAVRPLAFITLLPFGEKKVGRIGSYRIGFWPGERRGARSAAYANPEGFIRVTPENQDTYVSEHFRLRDFLTHDQQDVWPKYLVLREDLIDKLELVIDDLNAHGVAVEQLSVMSGFRTPQYNQQGVRKGGRARDSRHQFGDAADVYVDNDGDGRMDDLNHDGRVNNRDVQVLIDAVERVETAHPDLVGGAGRYRANRMHGPFVHIDVRGKRARWGNA
jgi:hypothetical protein